MDWLSEEIVLMKIILTLIPISVLILLEIIGRRFVSGRRLWAWRFGEFGLFIGIISFLAAALGLDIEIAIKVAFFGFFVVLLSIFLLTVIFKEDSE